MSYMNPHSKKDITILKILKKCCDEKKEARYRSIKQLIKVLDNVKNGNSKKRILYIFIMFSFCLLISFVLIKHIEKKREISYTKFIESRDYQEAVKIFPDKEETYFEAFDFFSKNQKDELAELEHLIQISNTKNIEIYKFLFYKYLEKDEIRYYRKAKQILNDQLKNCTEYVHYMSIVSMLASPYPLTKYDAQRCIQDLKEIEQDIYDLADKKIQQEQLLWLYQVYCGKEEVFYNEAFTVELQIIVQLQNTLYEEGLTKKDLLQMKAESFYRQGLYYQRQGKIQNMKVSFHETLKIEESIKSDIILRIKASICYILSGYDNDKTIFYLNSSIHYLNQIKKATKQDAILKKEVREKIKIWGI